MAQPSRIALALVATLLAACGGRAFDVGEPEPEPNGGTHQGGTGNSAGKNPGGSTSKGGTAAGAAGHGGGSGGSLCESFDDQAPHHVQVAIINKTSATIHLGQTMVDCSTSPPFSVTDANGKLLGLGDCRSPCQLVREHGPVGCPAICAYPSSITLQAGEVYYTSYNGLYGVQTTLPAECASGGEASCEAAVAIQPGNFQFFSQAGSGLDCSQTTGMCGACTPTGSGGCTTPGSLISGATLKAATNVYLDASYGVYGQARPAPLPLPGGGTSSGPVALATVELVFTD